MFKYPEHLIKNAELYTWPKTKSFAYRSDSGPGARPPTGARPGPDLTRKKGFLNAFSSYGCRSQVPNSARMKVDFSSPYISKKQNSLRRKRRERQKRAKRLFLPRVFPVLKELKHSYRDIKRSGKAGNLYRRQPKCNIMNLLLESAHTIYNDTSEDERDRREFNMVHQDILEAWKRMSDKNNPGYMLEPAQTPSKAAIKSTDQATSSPRLDDSTLTICAVKQTKLQDSGTPQVNKVISRLDCTQSLSGQAKPFSQSETQQNVQGANPEKKPSLSRPRFYRRNQKQKNQIQDSERSSQLSPYEVAYRKEMDRLDRERALKYRPETFQREYTCPRGTGSSFVKCGKGGGGDGGDTRSQVRVSSAGYCRQAPVREVWKSQRGIHEDTENSRGKRTSRASNGGKRDSPRRGVKGGTAKTRKSEQSEGFAGAEQAKRVHTFGRDPTGEQLLGRSNKPAIGAVKQAEKDKQRLVKKDKATKQKLPDGLRHEGETTGCNRKGEDCPAATTAKGCDVPNTESCFCRSREWDACLDGLEMLQNLQKLCGLKDREISNKVKDLQNRLCWHICEALQMQRKTMKTTDA